MSIRELICLIAEMRKLQRDKLTSRQHKREQEKLEKRIDEQLEQMQRELERIDKWNADVRNRSLDND